MTEEKKQIIIQLAVAAYKRKHGNTDTNEDDDVLELVRDKFNQNFIVNDERSKELSEEEGTIIIVIEPRHQYREIFEYCMYLEKMKIRIRKDRYERITIEEMKDNWYKAYCDAKKFHELINGNMENVRTKDRDRGESR